LNDQLRDKTETVHNLNDLLSRTSGEAVDKLASHYMTIEDELRAQLHSVKCEKEAIEMQMSVQSEESRRTVEELSITKQELAACVDQLSADLDIAQKQVATLESEMYLLRQAKEQANQIRAQIHQLPGRIQ
jgi:outer membrane murein-binding lipoprotein Lpp